jgi:hypothetical protein
LASAYVYAYEDGQAGSEAIYQSVKYIDLRLKHYPVEEPGPIIYLKGELYMSLYLENKNSDDLDRAINEFKDTTQHQMNQEDRQKGIMALNRALSERYNHKLVITDLYDVIQWGYVAVKENPNNLLALQIVADLLHWLYKDTKDIRALDKSIDYYEATWARCQQGLHKDIASFHYRFGIALVRRFDQNGRLQDIERAITFLRLAVVGASPQKLDRYEQCLMDAIARQYDAHADHLTILLLVIVMCMVASTI